jgi:hypothetical protein
VYIRNRVIEDSAIPGASIIRPVRPGGRPEQDCWESLSLLEARRRTGSNRQGTPSDKRASKSASKGSSIENSAYSSGRWGALCLGFSSTSYTFTTFYIATIIVPARTLAATGRIVSLSLSLSPSKIHLCAPALEQVTCSNRRVAETAHTHTHGRP